MLEGGRVRGAGLGVQQRAVDAGRPPSASRSPRSPRPSGASRSKVKSSYTSRVDARRNPDLTEIREAINLLDERIVELIGERQAWVEQAGRLKRDQGEDAVRAPARVDAVIARVRSLAGPAGASPEVVERTYRALITSFVELELGVHSRESTGH